MTTITSDLARGLWRFVAASVVFASTWADARAAESAPNTGVNQALVRARSEKKMVLLYFTGTDWCRECADLQAEVVTTTGFKEYATTNFILFEITLKADQESPLVERYNVSGWPTFVLLDADGREIDKVSGYRKGDGLETVIRDVEKCRKRR